MRTVPGTRLARLIGDQEVTASYHHQSVLAHPGYVPAAWADDGTLEAMEDPGAAFRLAVQWHPETGQDARLFEAPRRRLPVSGATDHIPRRGFTVRTGGGSLPPVKTTWAVMATATLIID